MKKARAILPSVACRSVQYFSTLSHQRHDFRIKKCIEHKIYVLNLPTNFVCKIPYSRKEGVKCD